MTKLLDQVIAKVRALPEADQDEAAEVLLWTIETRNAPVPLDEDARAAIDEGLAQARRGEFATDAEIGALWKRHGL
jgi:predicted transcriptional regulator